MAPQIGPNLLIQLRTVHRVLRVVRLVHRVKVLVLALHGSVVNVRPAQDLRVDVAGVVLELPRLVVLDVGRFVVALGGG